MLLVLIICTAILIGLQMVLEFLKERLRQENYNKILFSYYNRLEGDKLTKV